MYTLYKLWNKYRKMFTPALFLIKTFQVNQSDHREHNGCLNILLSVCQKMSCIYTLQRSIYTMLIFFKLSNKSKIQKNNIHVINLMFKIKLSQLRLWDIPEFYFRLADNITIRKKQNIFLNIHEWIYIVKRRSAEKVA